MKKQLQILVAVTLFLAMGIHAVMPLVSHSFDTEDFSSITFEEIEKEDVVQHKHLDFFILDCFAKEYKLALQVFDQKGASPRLFLEPSSSDYPPAYIAFSRLKLDC